jgi:hypothetical protein
MVSTRHSQTNADIVQLRIEVQRVHSAFPADARQSGAAKRRSQIPQNQQFTQVMPTFISCATRCPRFKLLVQIEAANPYFVSFAMATASSSESNGAMWHTGPKISSFTQRADLRQPSIDGWLHVKAVVPIIAKFCDPSACYYRRTFSRASW